MATRLLIVGGVAGGATAAARARRVDENAEITLFERGAYISFANCGLPYYIGHVIKDRDDLLLTTPEVFKQRYRIDVRVMSEVTAIDRQNKIVHVREHPLGKTYTMSYDKIILSPGAEPIKPHLDGIHNEKVFSLRSIPDSDRIRAFVDATSPERAVVIGGGFIGIEMAENLIDRGVATTILEMQDQVMAPLDYEMASLVHAHLKAKGISLALGEGVRSISPKAERLLITTTRENTLETDMVILSVGIAPENTLALEARLALCERGHIVVNSAMQTSDPDIYAVGDAVCIRDFMTGTHTSTALAGPANKQARIAADNALGRKSVFRGTQGTSVVKVFDLTVAATGSNEKGLKHHSIPYIKSYTHSGSHASYYPGAEAMSIKLLFSPGNGRILGCQIIGKDGVDKRIDIMATAIRAGMTVSDLEELELAYAPPYSSAKDPVNIAGYVAANIINGDMEVTHWDEMGELDHDKHVLIDLRNADELAISGKIEGALHIPLHELRDRLGELDREKICIPFCATGLRSYLAHRILIHHGFRSRNLSGGYKTYLAAREKIMQESTQTKLWLGE
ncbi:MAG: FAD-dependent oxidoreductase [Deltaproteobacteria bacterium]|nr:FAD-dependent oxidoreductase [Deltaproteobacteria bacterium]